MNRRQFILRSFSLFLAGLFAPGRLLAAEPEPVQAEASSTFTLAFGSCADQDKSQPVWNAIGKANPNVFCFLGDNIYADTEDMSVMRRKYSQFGRMPQFANFRKKFPVVATWDDHDYGMNDSGMEYPKKQSSKQQFLDFFEEPADSPRRKRKGIYTSYTYGEAGRRTQLILLDLRWFRSPLTKTFFGTGFTANPDPNSTLLGEEQWRWLEEQLKQPADFRILGSSIQFASEEHKWEKWANFPHEKARLLTMLDRLRVRNLLVISGDMHFGEISREATPAGQPVYDFTSSGLNYAEPAEEGNGKRVALFDTAPNFGLVTVDWTKKPVTVSLDLRDERGNSQIRKRFSLPAGSR